MQMGLIALGFAAVIGALAFMGFTLNTVVLCLLAWSALWLGIWQAKRLRVTAGNEAQAIPATSATSYWGKRLGLLLISLVIGVGAYTQYLVREYELPDVYQWQAMAWVLGVNRPTPTLIKIPAGSFEMGSNEGDDDEKPVHRVTIAKPFLMGQSEVTFTEYDYAIWQIKQAGLTNLEFPTDEGWGRNQRPVINVSWSQSQAYLYWLSQNNPQSLVCRLPSESEWEYAARAGSTPKFYWGNEPSRDYANFGKEECCEGVAEGNDKWVNTAPVKSFKPNRWGLYDMSGNVYEWTKDFYHKNYEGAPIDGSALESGSEASRVLRGGSWYVTSDDVRSAVRNFIDGGFNVGFRVICSPIEH